MPSTNLETILILLLAAVLVVAIFRRMNLSPVLGYLVAGMAIGPSGMNIIGDVSRTQYIAEFGVVFLLFYIGLELTLERIKAMRRYVIGFGTFQMLITAALISYVAYLSHIDARTAIIIGGGLAL